MNEPSTTGVAGTQRIFEIVSSLGPSDVCFCLLTGGASALLPAPVPEISLDDKVQLTRLISGAGGNMLQLNVGFASTGPLVVCERVDDTP